MGGSRFPYSTGPLAAAHAPFANQCQRCHVSRPGRLASQLDDGACLACHDAPVHRSNQTFTPACATCHAEHRGRVVLAATAEQSCLQCHRSLRTRNGVLSVSAAVGSFPTASHPEFAAVRPGARDRTVLRFNHELHLKRDLRGPSGSTTLDCATCHRVPGRTSASGLVPKITYARDCATCHSLYFDPLIGTETPHDSPEVVHAAIVQSLSAYISAHPEQVNRPDPVRRVPLNFAMPSPVRARTADEWIRLRTAAAERLLWSKTCAECHDFVPAVDPNSLPKEVPTNMPSVWMPRARFDHRSHQLATCTSCHAAQSSRDTSDVLLPSIATCRRCHSSTAGDRSTESRCFECHQYHDWSKATPIRDGAFDVNALTR
jgi:hypothetical protein